MFNLVHNLNTKLSNNIQSPLSAHGSITNLPRLIFPPANISSASYACSRMQALKFIRLAFLLSTELQ